MSETAGAPSGVDPVTRTHPVTGAGASPGTGPGTAPGTHVGHESYAFACMSCGHGWEQSYEIRHYTDAKGRPFVVYYADGERVPSPLGRPTCPNCDAHVVRIMRSGQVSVIADALHLTPRTEVPRTDQPAAGPVFDGGGRESQQHHHWHLSDLLKPFHRK
ncbi:hypothetical protein GCM10010218_52280 [Streptomyces mashuensis]|uniref:Uncharacterized protein n=1 Tax=Streptomyces mashuensis TaxID=33904 RepID=A0A919EFD5_9ACTN|nr:hypothetical protein [Streptomyces mashuensis]GHF64296.1 hypothetical protein GCM10010218_52280 [Streptomyces mashuensis]